MNIEKKTSFFPIPCHFVYNILRANLTSMAHGLELTLPPDIIRVKGNNKQLIVTEKLRWVDWSVM